MQQPQDVQIYIQPPTGRKITIDANENDTGLILKLKILQKIGIPVEQQRLISCGNEWLDSQTNNDVRAANPATKEAGFMGTLHLVPKRPNKHPIPNVYANIEALRAYGESLMKGQNIESDRHKIGSEACTIAEFFKTRLDAMSAVNPMETADEFMKTIKVSKLNKSRDGTFGHIFANILLALTGVGFIAQVVNKCATGSFGFFFRKQTTRQDYADNIIESLNNLPQ